MTTYVVAPNAYAKVAFHAAKYPHKQVNGIMIGKEESGVVECTDAVPLLHHWTSLSPCMEIGLDLARNYALSKGLDVVGYYQACEQLTDTSLAPVGEKVADTVRKSFSNAVAFVVDGSKLVIAEPALIPYLPQGSSTSWKPASEQVQPFAASSRFKLSSPGVASDVLRLIRDSKAHQKLGDFDDHLEDVSIDWLRNEACNVDK